MDDRHALLASINSLTQRKETLLHEISNIELELTVQTAKYARVLNTDAPIYRLPNELLTDILLSCQRDSLSAPPRRKTAVPFQVIASHVSHRWRTVVLATPLLWNTIDLHIRIENHSQGRMKAQLEAHLARSAACFVDVTLDFVFMSAAEPYFDMLKLHSLRWRRLAVATNHENVSAFSRLLADVRAPQLEHLSLSVGRPQNDDRPSSPRRPYIVVLPTILNTDSGVPLLSFVRLAGYALGTLHPPLSAVTTLHLDGWTRHYITPEQLRSVLSSAPLLINLSLNQLVMHLPRDPLVNVPPLPLPALRQLRLRGPCSPAARFLLMVDMPRLRALALQGIDTFDCGVLPSVRELSLDMCALDEVDVGRLFHAFPNVERFSVDDSLPQVWTMLLPEEDEEEDEEDMAAKAAAVWLAYSDDGGGGGGGGAGERRRLAPRQWPMLRTLVLRELQAVDVRHFCFLVICLCNPVKPKPQQSRADDIDIAGPSRPAPPRGLTTVCLDRRSRTVLRTKHRLSWLEERVVVQHCDTPEAWPRGLRYVDAHDWLE